MNTRASLGALVASLIAVSGGCGKTESPTGTAAAPGQSATPPSGAMASDLGKAMGQASAQAKEQIVTALTTQLQTQQQQVTTLKTDAAKYTDQQLDTLIKGLEGKLTAAADKLKQLRSAEGGTSSALQTEVQKLLGEAGDLYKQATDRLATLVKG